jgi:RNA polymerase sigma-70 factor (ECF subfamily)
VDYPALSPSELFSVCASRGGSACWEEFIRRFNPVIARSVLRVAIRHGNSERSLIDDLVQETYLKICASDCKLLRTFIPKHPESAFAFLKVVATSVAQDYFKSRLAQKRAPEAKAGTVEDITVASRHEAPKGVLNHAERDVLINQIDRRLGAVVPAGELQRARTVFWLYYRAGFTASAIASLPTLDLTTKGVESLLFRLTRLVREHLSGASEGNQESKKGIQQAESF